MICPNCKAEYREGITRCSDCQVELIESPGQEQKISRVSSRGENIIKFGIGLLFFVFTQIIISVMVYQFYFVYKMTHGGVSGTAISNIHPMIWTISIIEIVIVVTVIIWGANKKEIE